MTTPTSAYNPKPFTPINVAFGALLGVLIALPLVANLTSVPMMLGEIIAGALGAAVGYRRRTSRSFFYFAAICILVLSVIVVTQTNLSGIQP